MEEQNKNQNSMTSISMSTLILIMVNRRETLDQYLALREVKKRLTAAGMSKDTQDLFIQHEMNSLYNKEVEPLFLQRDLSSLSENTFSLFFDAVHNNDITGLMFSELILLKNMRICFEMEAMYVKEIIEYKKTHKDPEQLPSDCLRYFNFNKETLREAKELLQDLSKKEYEFVYSYLYNIDKEWFNHKTSLDKFVQNEAKLLKVEIYAIQQAVAFSHYSIDYESKSMQRVLSKYQDNIIIFPSKKQ